MPKIEYSCKRKKDFVTFAAITMFVAICLFEIYLIVFLRIQLQRENAMASEVLKQEMISQTSMVRYRVRNAKPSTPLQRCEVNLVTNCLDSVVRYVRANIYEMTDPQIIAANEILFQLNGYSKAWGKKQYTFKQDEFEVQPVLNMIELKLDQASAAGY